MISPDKRNIAMVFQNYALYPHMTVAENMGFSLRLQHVARAIRHRIVGETANVLSLSELLRRQPAQLSGGQRQRVAMGRAMVRDPTGLLYWMSRSRISTPSCGPRCAPKSGNCSNGLVRP